MKKQRKGLMSNDSQIAKENLKCSQDGLSQRQAPGTNPPVKALWQGRRWVWGMTHRRAFK